jgi:hypothetical protein
MDWFLLGFFHKVSSREESGRFRRESARTLLGCVSRVSVVRRGKIDDVQGFARKFTALRCGACVRGVVGSMTTTREICSLIIVVLNLSACEIWLPKNQESKNMFSTIFEASHKRESAGSSQREGYRCRPRSSTPSRRRAPRHWAPGMSREPWRSECPHKNTCDVFWGICFHPTLPSPPLPSHRTTNAAGTPTRSPSPRTTTPEVGGGCTS